MQLGLPKEWIARQAAGAVRQGLSLDVLLADSLIDLDAYNAAVPTGPAQWLLLCLNTIVGVEDAAHGLAAARINPGMTDIGVRVTLGCTTLEGAFNAVSRFYSMSSSGLRFRLQEQHDLAILSVHVESTSDRDAIQIEETYLIWIFMMCMHFLGRPLPIVRVTTRDPLHFNMDRRHFGLGGQVHHGPATDMRFSRSLLQTRGINRGGDNTAWECSEIWLDFVEGSPNTAPLSHGHGYVAQAARQAGVSPSTMRRRLQPIEGNFRDARQHVLVDAAMRLLQEDALSVEAIAAELGYADARSFRRFLKNATGFTPQQMRDREDMLKTHQLVRRRLKAVGAELGAWTI